VVRVLLPHVAGACWFTLATCYCAHDPLPMMLLFGVLARLLMLSIPAVAVSCWCLRCWNPVQMLVPLVVKLALHFAAAAAVSLLRFRAHTSLCELLASALSDLCRP
jgi:hypothetical protein